MNEIFELAEEDPRMNALVRFLYDAAARVQDCENLRVAPFIALLKAAGKDKSIIMNLVAKKSQARRVNITPATIAAISKLIGNRVAGFIF